MWVVKVSDVMAMGGVPQSHEALQASGLLVKHKPGSFCIFVSHQRLGRCSRRRNNMPDETTLAVVFTFIRVQLGRIGPTKFRTAASLEVPKGYCAVRVSVEDR